MMSQQVDTIAFATFPLNLNTIRNLSNHDHHIIPRVHRRNRIVNSSPFMISSYSHSNIINPSIRPAVSSTTSSHLSLTATDYTQKAFEPIAPDTNILIGFGFVVILSIIAAVVWANEVVPVSRTKLALSKRDGAVKQYLDELKKGENTYIVDETQMITTVIDEDENTTTKSEQDSVSNNNNNMTQISNIEKNQQEYIKKSDDGRDFERWLFTDWLRDNKSARKRGGRQKEPALPILKSAKWNSGDNPVLVTTLLLLVGVTITSVTERIGSLVNM